MNKLKDSLFWKKVKKQPSGCWEWQGGLTRTGYGLVTRRKIRKTMLLAHRYSWYLKHGKFPDNCCCHTCDNRKCVNPDHLWEGTHKQNMKDMASKFRHGRTELNKDDIIKIKNLIPDTPVKEIATIFGVSNEIVYLIKRGVTWDHVK